MPRSNKSNLSILENNLNLLRSMICKAFADLTDVQIVEPADPVYNSPPQDASWQDIGPERRWGHQNGWTYLRGKATVVLL